MAPAAPAEGDLARRELQHGTARRFMDAVGPKGCTAVTEEGIVAALKRMYLLYDFGLLHSQFAEADFENDGFLEEHEIHAALTGRYKYRAFNDDWIALACTLLRTDSIHVPRLKPKNLDLRRRRGNKARAVAADLTWTWKAQRLRDDNCRSAPPPASESSLPSFPDEIQSDVPEAEAHAVVAESLRRRASRAATPASQRLNWPPPGFLSTALGSRSTARTDDEALVAQGKPAHPYPGEEEPGAPDDSRVGFDAQARFAALRNLATAKAKAIVPPPPPPLPRGVERAYGPSEPGAPLGGRVHLEGALKGGYAAEPRRAANARNFLPTRAMLPLTAAGKPILLHSAFFQHASVPFQRNFHPLKPGDATTYYQPLGQRMNLKPVFMGPNP